jgi:hypothetical protein
MLNKKPYSGLFVLSSLDKLAPPAGSWKLSEDGKLMDENVPDLECATYVDCIPETDNCANIGHNEKFKPAPAKPAPTKQKPQSKSAQPQSSSSTAKPAVHPSEQNEATHNETRAEATNTPQQEPSPQNEPPKKRSHGVAGLLEKLGESVKQGETERVCSDVARSMGQCN